MSFEVSTFGHQNAFIKISRALNWFKSAKNQISTGELDTSPYVTQLLWVNESIKSSKNPTTTTPL